MQTGCWRLILTNSRPAFCAQNVRPSASLNPNYRIARGGVAKSHCPLSPLNLQTQHGLILQEFTAIQSRSSDSEDLTGARRILKECPGAASFRCVKPVTLSRVQPRGHPSV